ncbi:MAG: alpha/beta hydrolase, partial [Planctomycetaceae bacterium]|nr:alpha/beta hydrolase [Planctomycetaceae bacterium]
MGELSVNKICRPNGIEAGDVITQSPKNIISLGWHLLIANYKVHDFGDGIPILFMHGFPFDSSMWYSTANILLSANQTQPQKFLNYRTIMPDLPGLGQSELPREAPVPTPYGVSIDRYAYELEDVLDELGVKEPVVVVGLSMGGYIAIQFANDYSEIVSGLVLCNTKTAKDSEEVKTKRLDLMDSIRAASPDEAAQILEQIADSMIPKLFAAKTYSDKPEIVERVRSMITSNNPLGVSAATWGMAVRDDTSEFLANVKCPVLVIGGDEDQFTPPSTMKQLAEIAKSSKYVEIPNAGHLPPMEQPQLFAAA